MRFSCSQIWSKRSAKELDRADLSWVIKFKRDSIPASTTVDFPLKKGFKELLMFSSICLCLTAFSIFDRTARFKLVQGFNSMTFAKQVIGDVTRVHHSCNSLFNLPVFCNTVCQEYISFFPKVYTLAVILEFEITLMADASLRYVSTIKFNIWSWSSYAKKRDRKWYSCPLEKNKYLCWPVSVYWTFVLS